MICKECGGEAKRDDLCAECYLHQSIKNPGIELRNRTANQDADTIARVMRETAWELEAEASRIVCPAFKAVEWDAAASAADMVSKTLGVRY